jgi:ketosteroid isomerase-like protein
MTSYVEEEAAVRRMLDEYYSAFGSLNADLILPYYHEPAVLIGAAGVFPAADRKDLEKLVAPFMEHMRAQGYARSELELRQLTVLSATDALALGLATRYNAEGLEISRMGVTYLLHRGEEGWKIAVLTMHEPC